MKRKTVALVLASVLGFNTLFFTTGNFDQKGQVVYAQQQERLKDPQDINKLTGIELETLQTTIESVTDNDVILTFKDVNKDNVENVSGSLSYTKFTERPNTDTNGSVSVDWDKNTGKATVKGMNAPGIYSGDVTVKYKDGTEKVYALTLRKTYEESKSVLTASVNVGIGTIEITNVKVDGQSKTIGANNTLELYLDGKPIDANGNKFTVLGMEAGQVYELVYKENGNEVAKAQIILTEQEQATIKAYVTNTSTAVSEIKTAIENDYGVSNVDVTQTAGTNDSTYLQNTNFDFKVDGTSVLDYTQTETTAEDSNGARRQGGAKISVPSNSTTNSDLMIDVGGENVDLLYLNDANRGNFLPSNWMKWGPPSGNWISFLDFEHRNVAYGQGLVNIDGQPKVLYDFSSKISNSNVGSSVKGQLFPPSITTYKDLDVYGGVKPSSEIGTGATSTGAIDANNLQVDVTSFSYDTTKVGHGYTSIPVEFTSQEGPIPFSNEQGEKVDKTVDELIAEVDRAAADTNGGVPIIPERAEAVDTTSFFVTNHTTTPVTASVVIAKDAIKGNIVNAKFERVSLSEGNLILIDGKELLKGTDENTLAKQLTINGSNAGVVSVKQNANDLVFEIKFNGQVPSTINWKLNGLEGTININGIDAVNFDGEVKLSNENTSNLENEFDIVAKFNSTVPTGGTLVFDGKSNLRVTFNDLTNGSHKISTTTTTGKYQGTYSAGIVVSRKPFIIEVRDAKEVSSTSASLVVDANFFSTDDISKVSGGVIQYSEKIVNGNTTTWSDWKDSSAKVDKSEVKEEAITKTVDGLTTGKTYKFRAVYDYNNGSTTEKIYSNETGEVTLRTPSVNSTITGSGSTTGTSGGSTTIYVTTSNSTSYRASVSVNLPSGFSYDLGKNPVPVKITYRDLDGKIVTESKEQFSNVIAKFENGKIVLEGLVPGKDYSEISIDYIDNNGKTKTLVLKNVKVDFTTELEKYLANVYQVVFGRPADEVGYHFHLKNLMDKKVSLKEFLLNMLSEKEFIEKYKSAEEKIEALYSAIVSRSSDEVGKKFWVEEYKKLFEVYGSESTALKVIADRMVNENELKELADKIGVQW